MVVEDAMGRNSTQMFGTNEQSFQPGFKLGYLINFIHSVLPLTTSDY